MNRVPSYKNWVTYNLGSSGFLHCHPDLKALPFSDKNRDSWYLLGIAVPVRYETPILDEVTGRSPEEIWEASRGWAGRWVLVGQDRIGMDACGTLGVFYNPVTREATSSPTLITTGKATHDIELTDRWNWFAPPRSRFEGVRRLLPSQFLSLTDYAPIYRPLLVPMPARTYEEVLDELEIVLKRTMRGMTKLGTTIMPITGGYDSRLILSTLAAIGVKPETYTLQHDAGLTVGDRELPPRIANALGLSHRLIPRPAKPVYPDAFEAYTAQSGGHAIEQDRNYIAYGQFDHISDKNVLFIGGTFEVGRFYYKSFPDTPSLNSLKVFEPIPTVTKEAIGEYFEWTEAHPENLDWRDRFYWEQRLGGWISASSLGTDMVPGIRLPPANSHYTLSLLLTVPLEIRRTSRHHVDLVARMTPELVGIPFNIYDPFLVRAVRMPKKLVRKIRRWIQVR